MVHSVSPPGRGTSAGWKTGEHDDHLVAFFKPRSEVVETSWGPSEAARCELVACIDCVRVFTDALVFGKALVPRLVDGNANG
jgi:hypothetical protein